ncbi:MAG: hypothetical protein ACXVXP_16005 [Mycobacteriaceae bacterium]
MRDRVPLAAVVLVALGAFAGCTTELNGARVNHPPTSESSAASNSPSPTLTATAPAGTPLGAGERVWAAFSHRGVSYEAWWARLEPLLSEAARAVYVYDDPSKIPSMTITGKIHLAAKAPAEARYTAEVVVPTSKGVFGLDLERREIGSPWLLYAIKFPPAVR